jgi:hypothetical protein
MTTLPSLHTGGRQVPTPSKRNNQHVKPAVAMILRKRDRRRRDDTTTNDGRQTPDDNNNNDDITIKHCTGEGKERWWRRQVTGDGR